MKTILPLFTLLLVFFTLFSQPYQPVAVENAHWFMFAIAPNGNADHHAFVVRGDTMIDLIAYKKIYYQDLANQWPFGAPYLLEEERLWGVVRDDSLNRRVYVVAYEPYAYGYHCPVGEEQLLFDFSILPGDSTAHCLWSGGNPWILDSTYASYQYGANRRTLYAAGWISPRIFEGIGSDNGLFGTIYQILGDDEYWLHEYCVGTDADCGIISSAHALPEAASGLAAFPNPARETVYLKTDIPFTPEARIWVFDLFGRPVYQGLFPAAKKGISVGGWAPGLYLLQVEEGGRRYAVKFVKAQH
jgi:hypothetical protein